jgi:hypothetical protein
MATAKETASTSRIDPFLKTVKVVAEFLEAARALDIPAREAVGLRILFRANLAMIGSPDPPYGDRAASSMRHWRLRP